MTSRSTGFSEEAVERVRHLLLKKSAGTLTDDEADELDVCMQLDRLRVLICSRALERPTSPAGKPEL